MTGGSEGFEVICWVVVIGGGIVVRTVDGVGVSCGVVWFWDVVVHPETSTRIAKKKTMMEYKNG